MFSLQGFEGWSRQLKNILKISIDILMLMWNDVLDAKFKRKKGNTGSSRSP